MDSSEYTKRECPGCGADRSVHCLRDMNRYIAHLEGHIAADSEDLSAMAVYLDYGDRQVYIGECDVTVLVGSVVIDDPLPLDAADEGEE